MAVNQHISVHINVDNTTAYIHLVDQMGKDLTEYLAKRIVSTMKGSMRGPKSGNVYERHGIRYQASAQGEAPAVPPAAWRRGFSQGRLELKTRGGLITGVRGVGAFFRRNRGASVRLNQLTSLTARREKRGGSFTQSELNRINRETMERIEKFEGYLQAHGVRGNVRSMKQRGSKRRKLVEGYESELPGGLIETIKAEPISEDGKSWGIQMHELGVWLEFGTAHFAARPFIVPAVEKWRVTVPKLYSEYINKNARAIEKSRGRNMKALMPSGLRSLAGDDQ